MIYIAYFILFFIVLQLLIAFANFVFREKLTSKKSPDSNLKISVLIPARNEEANIGNILSDIIQTDKNIVEIVVYDDFSSDNTAKIVSEFKLKDSRIKLLPPKEMPAGWLGKNFACHQLSLNAAGDYFLFIDADIRIKNSLINKTLSYVEENGADLLSIFPKQEMRSFAEKITVPNMQIILLSLLFLPFVKLIRSFPSISASNGQFMLIKSSVYRELLPHLTYKGSSAEDIEIAKYFKKKRKKVSCITGISDITCRMYHSLNEAVNGFSKNVIYFFGGSYLLSFLFWTITTLGFIPLWIAFGWKGLVSFYAIQILTRLFISLHSRQSVIENVIFMIFQQMMLGVFIVNSLISKKTKRLEWKGRKI